MSLTSTSKIILQQLKSKFTEAYSSSMEEFVPALRRFINALNKTSFYKTMPVAFLNENETKWKEKPEEVAKMILKGDSRIFNDPFYREVVSYFIIHDVYKEGKIPPHLTSIIKNEYLKPFWERIERTITESDNILYLLLKFKKRCEWYERYFILKELHEFRNDKMKQATEKSKRNVNVRIEEGFFAPGINCYLFDNCIEVISEPKVKEKRIDVIGVVKGQQFESSDFLLEYKVLLRSNRNQKPYLIKAFYQAYWYGKHYQKNIVYLIIFTIGEGDINLNLNVITFDETPIHYYEYDGIRILAIKINLKDEKSKNEINKKDLDNFFRDCAKNKVLV